ncbi:MAG: ATP-binding protein [Thermoflexales bacterium]
MRRVINRPFLTQFLTGAVFVGTVTGLLLLLQSLNPVWFEPPIVVLAYLLAISLTSQWAGFYPSAAAAIIAFLCFNFFFIEPRLSLLVSSSIDSLVLAVFLGVALVISRLLGRARRNAIQAEQRERDAARFYELSLALISTRDPGDIAATLANRLRGILSGPVEVTLQPDPNAPPVRRSAPDGDLPLAAPSQLEIIKSASGTFGEIRVWNAGPLTPGNERLLRTFAGETALVLERLRASRAETRAAVLEESDRLKTALLGSVSHELRTPLATIRAGAESLLSGLVPADSSAGREILDDVRDASQRLTRLVDNMLDMTRIESGALKPALEWTDLTEIVNSAALRLRNETGRHRLEIDVPDDLPLVPADPVQLDQVITNLISNSVKYSPAGTLIRVIARREDDARMLVQIANESPRMPPEDLARIFDRFYRVTHADKVMGTGLGLSICKGIVDAHSGRIWAENRPPRAGDDSRGFIFNISLPLTWNGAAPRMPPPE